MGSGTRRAHFHNLKISLVRIDEADLTPEVLRSLSSELGRSGWIVQHIPSGTHINWNFIWE